MGTRGSTRGLALTLAFAMWFPSAVRAEDVSAYRGFRLGMTVFAVAAAAGVSPTVVKVIVARPLLIQELLWRPPSAASTAGAPTGRGSVVQVLFGFCNGELYRMVVSYDPDMTEGLSEQDLVEALSAAYGPAGTPTPLASIVTSPASQSYSDTDPVTARWEDARSSVSLFRGTYRSNFGLVIYSKALAPVARARFETGLRLTQLDAPGWGIAEQTLRDEAERVVHARARVANKAAFRY